MVDSIFWGCGSGLALFGQAERSGPAAATAALERVEGGKRRKTLHFLRR